MALKYPDKLEHNNSANPLIDDSELAGGYVTVADVNDRNTIPLAKRKQYMLVGYNDGIIPVVKQYINSDVSNTPWVIEDNWVSIGGVPTGYVEVSVEICTPDGPQTGKILFKADP